MLMKTRVEPIDFHVVEPHHEGMHKRLENWAKWCRYSGGGSSALPMFQLYRPDNYEREFVGISADGTDAQRIMKGVFKLPLKHRAGLNWFYLRPTNPRGMCQKLGVSFEGLADLVTTARFMLINMKI